MFFLGIGAALQQHLQFLALVPDTRLHPSIFWCALAAINGLVSVASRAGLMAVLWGGRVLTPERWRSINLGTSCYLLALAALALPIGLTANAEVWAFFKLYVQPLLLMIWPAWAVTLANR